MHNQDDLTPTDPATTGATANTEPTGDLASQAILRDLISERNTRKELQTQLAGLQEAEADRARGAAEEQGKYQELYSTQRAELEKLRAAHGELTARETSRIEALRERNTAAIGALPESYRGLIPVGMDPDSVASQIEAILGIVTAPPGHPTGAQAHGGKPRGISDEARAWADKYRTTPEIAQKVLDQSKARQTR